MICCTDVGPACLRMSEAVRVVEACRRAESLDVVERTRCGSGGQIRARLAAGRVASVRLLDEVDGYEDDCLGGVGTRELRSTRNCNDTVDDRWSEPLMGLLDALHAAVAAH